MKQIVCLLIAHLVFAGDWELVRRIPTDQKVELTTKDGVRTRAIFLSAGPDSLRFRETAGERSVAKAEIRKLKVSDPMRRVRRGLLWTAVGAGVGVGLGIAMCPGCANEGSGAKFVGPSVAAGAAVGALGFLSSPYHTVYQDK
ncbi:hypothetical protein [Bryobacter aggregatus]|uniref:hypothetical protein n=1 Tax=Bryobacter aggregatus TaxID=360054 RepID=UPI0004E14B62|nr:hypothetical protein [Bryobacter aggregatus]